jgi:hypothetical protein
LDIYYFVKQFGNQVKLVFLQLPVYSIHEFNAYQGYQEENSFKEDDYITTHVSMVYYQQNCIYIWNNVTKVPVHLFI